MEWFKAWTPILLAALGMATAALSKMESGQAKSDASVAASSVVALTDDQANTAAVARRALAKATALEKDMKLVKLAVGRGGQQTTSRRHGELPADAGVVPSSPGLIQNVTGGIAAFGRGFWHAIGGR